MLAEAKDSQDGRTAMFHNATGINIIDGRSLKDPGVDSAT